MPLLALHRFRAHVSKKYFYNFGIHCVNKAAYTLFFTLLFICFISYSVVREHIYPTRQLDFIDGYAWLFSPHVTLKRTTSDSDFVIQQLYIATHQRTITKDLLNNAADIYTSLTTLTLGDVSLQDICITSPQSTCLVHSPLEYWNNNLDLTQSDHDVVETINKQMHNTSNTTQLSLHPFTMMGNIIFDDSGHFESADSIIMTFLLKNNTLEIWDALWQHTLKELELYQKQLEVSPLSLQYKLKILPSITTHTVIVILCAIGILTYIKVCFSRSHLFKSTTGLGMAVLVSSIACYTTTICLLELFQKQTYVTPWFVQIFVCTTATLEHALLLTGAVASRRKDISVKERIGKGYQQVGILMTSTLIGELFVLVIGSTIHDDNIKSFCMFSSVAIILAYVLNLTLYTAILSIDIRRAELTDLGIDGDEKNHDFHNHDNYGRKFKTRRAMNALFLCFILLYLSVFKPTVEQSIQINKTQHKQLSSISANFWHVVNPLQNTVSLTIQPIRVVFTNKEDESAINHQVTCLTSYYDEKLHALQAAISDDRGFDISPFVLFLLRVNIPNITLIIIFIGILMWTIPPIREQLLLPFLRIVYIRIFKLLLLTTSKLMPFIKIDYLIKKVQREYSEEGVHIGAISMQSQYNKLQNESNVKNVKVQTLLGKHVADISSLDSKGNKVMSVDQYGKIILWDSEKDEWMARLDCLLQVKGKRWFAEKNPYYFTKQADIKTLSITQLPRAQCVQVDLEGKCGIAGFEDGTVRVWDLDTVQLVHELSVKEKIQHDSTTKNPSERVVKIVFLEEEGRNSSPKSIVSVHKSGIIREWNISSGEMIQNINSGHAREITNICVVYNNQHSNQLYIFTSSKDGMIRCWNRNQGRWSYRYTIQEKSEVTSIATEQLHNGMGILVSGSVDGAVKVWNIHTGDILSTLSKASAIKKVVPEIEVGGPILQFSRITESSNDFHSSYNNLLNKQNMSISNHSDAVCQVVATRVSNPEYTNDRCPSCNTTINSGFFVASSSLDYTVHTWRLDRTEIEKNAGCTTCAKHYHRKQHYDYSAGPVSALKSQHRRKHSNYNSGDESDSNNSQAELSLRPLFLGKLPQISSHGLIFCKNMVLAGVRHHYIQSESNIFLTERDDEIQWEAWFASLQYYEPPSLEKDTSLIPVITIDLEADFSFTDPSLEKEKKSLSMQSLWDSLLLHVFSIKKVRSSAITSRTKRNSMYKEDAEDQAKKRNPVPEMYHDDDDEYDANDILPFPAIRYVISTNGHGFCCDYGNFIKIVSFDDPHVNRSTEKQEYINKD